MISLLIPTYNYDASSLVLELHKQCMESRVDFEIIVIDDGSNTFFLENEKINMLQYSSFESLEDNIGRSKMRNLLAEKAKFEWLLFMDCDTFPTKKDFIHNYIVQINKNEKVVYGGIQYKKEKPNNDQLLRWFYGNARESLSVEKRNTNPNGNALTSNIVIKKNIFISNKFDESITNYGYEDLVFLSDLKKKEVLVKHIDNPTYHLGLETSKQFLDKTKIALKNLKSITKNNPLDSSESKIFRIYFSLKRFYLVGFVAFLFNKTERKIEQNLVSQKPSLLLFDFFKLGFYCSINN
jgi:glycosyltransferase involved in cell wall biosynthesis